MIKVVTTRDLEEGRARELFEALDVDRALMMKKSEDMVASGNREALVRYRDSRQGFEGNTLLHNSAMIGDLSVVRFLLKHGAEIDAFNSSASLMTPLMMALSFDMFGVALELARAGARLEIQDRNGENAFHYVARSGSAMTLQALVEAAQLSGQAVQALASVVNIKLKFPEDLASGVCREILLSYREIGHYVRKPRMRDLIKKKAEKRKKKPTPNT